jgi:hypothetical protein
VNEALNLSTAFSPRSRESVVVCLSRGFAVSLFQSVPPGFVSVGLAHGLAKSSLDRYLDRD